MDVRMTLGLLTQRVQERLAADRVEILLFNPRMQTLGFLVGSDALSRTVSRTEQRLSEGWAGQVVRERRMIALPATQSKEFASYYGFPLIAKGYIKGVLEIYFRVAHALDREWIDFAEAVAAQAAIAIDNGELFTNLQRANYELTLSYDATIEGWSRALDLRDKETEGHTQRVTELAERLARQLGMRDADLVHVRRGALLHDIGKMGVPDAILHKPAVLDDAEWEIMRTHPTLARDLLEPIAYLRPALDIPYCHHEKWDGTGYPRGLKGEEIPLAARLFAVVDVWDALTSERPYRPAWSKEQARAYIQEQAGKHFDPRVVEAFLRMQSESET
jgi:putative nucleotidyltransferase with HDIG domain